VPAKNYLSSLRFVNKEAFEQMSTFTKDEARVPVEINKLNNQILVHYFNEEWGVVN
jgi:spermidine synthase